MKNNPPNSELIQQIEQLENKVQQYKEQLNISQKSHLLLDQVIGQNTVPTFVLNTDHTIKYWNKACDKLTGFSSSEMIGSKNQWEAFYPEERPVMADLILDATPDSEIVKLYGVGYHRSNLIDGAWEGDGFFPHMKHGGKWLFVTAALLKDGQGNPIGAIETLRDITELKRMVEGLRDNEQKFHIVADYTYGWEYWVDPTGEYIYISPSCERVTGYDPSEFIRDRDLIRKICHVDDRPFLENHLRKDLDSREVHQFDFRIISSTNEQVWISHICQPVFNSSGKLLGRRASNHDITERKQTEKSLKETQERYQALFQRSPYCVYIHDLEGIFIDANQAALDLLGYTKEEISKLNFATLLDKEQIPVAIRMTQEIINTGSQKGTNEYSLKTKDGRFVLIETNGGLIFRDGKPYAIQGVACDITERKKIEEALRKNEELFRIVADYTYDWECWIDPEGKYLYVSPSCERLTGYKPHDFINNPNIMQKIIHRADRPSMKKHREEESASREVLFIDFRINSPTGEVHWISHVCHPVYDNAGRFLGRRISNRDVTESAHLHL
ncbi:MAG: PAS domain-containing protein [Deltaproteobacteria bacterium]|nr:PAS domain-containing protein [Deltaproteobacteria bacterium]